MTIARIGQGTWDVPLAGARRDEAARALRRGIELGMTHIDTAEMYGSGGVEEFLGEALRGIARERLFVTSKVLPENAGYDGTIAACERSLQRMRLEYLDLYLLHWPGPHPLDQTMRALEALVTTGKARHIGVSNFDLDELREAQSYLQAVPLFANEVLYHLGERGVDARLMPYCREQDIAVIGYTPFGRGSAEAIDRRGGGVLARIARERDATVRQVILNFLTRLPQLYAIPKAASVAHVEENAGALAWSLDAAEIAAIDAAYPVHDGPLATL